MEETENFDFSHESFSAKIIQQIYLPNFPDEQLPTKIKCIIREEFAK
jgi:hypothetical protein